MGSICCAYSGNTFHIYDYKSTRYVIQIEESDDYKIVDHNIQDLLSKIMSILHMKYIKEYEYTTIKFISDSKQFYLRKRDLGIWVHFNNRLKKIKLPELIEYSFYIKNKVVVIHLYCNIYKKQTSVMSVRSCPNLHNRVAVKPMTIVKGYDSDT